MRAWRKAAECKTVGGSHARENRKTVARPVAILVPSIAAAPALSGRFPFFLEEGKHERSHTHSCNGCRFNGDRSS
jgi:hypothetical protein